MPGEYFNNSTKEDAGEDFSDEEHHHIWDKKKSFEKSSIPFALMGIGFLVLIILFVVFLAKTKNVVDKKQVAVLEKRLRQMEERMGKIQGIDEKLILLETEGKKFQMFIDRFDRFETSMSLRMDLIGKELENFQKKGAKVKPVKTIVPEQREISKKKTDTIYHQVHAGETLYQISRRYGLTVDELRSLNKLKPEAAIYPGQQLIISPVESR